MKAIGRPRLAAVGAAVLSLLFAGPVSATDWDPPFLLADAGFANSLAMTGGYRAIALYTVPDDDPKSDVGELFMRRRIGPTGTGGIWSSPQLLRSNVQTWTDNYPEVAASGEAVSVIWANGNRRVGYMRSSDAGRTFPYGVQWLSPKAQRVEGISLDRRGDLVVVAWQAFNSDFSEDLGTFVRISDDGGDHFGPATNFAAGSPSVAIGKGVIYLAYRRGAQGLYVRRSFNGGATWTSLQQGLVSATASAYLYWWGNITAAGDIAYVAYVSWTGGDDTPTVRTRRTLDRGGTWGPTTQLDPAALLGGYAPIITLQGGVARVVWNRCVDADCRAHLYYRESTDTGWTSPERVAFSGLPGGVGFADKIIVLYGTADGVFVRTGTP